MIPAARVLVILPVAGLVMLSAACAKRPMVTAASAPAPAGASAPAPAPPPAPAPAPERAPAPEPAAKPPAEAAPAPATAGTTVTPAPATAAPAPPQPTARPAEFRQDDALQRIHFDFDKADIRPGDATVLDRNAEWLKANDVLVLVEGHCDERGTDAYNLALGERRARAVRNYLAARGIQQDRMAMISYGEERPVCTEKSEPCWAQNRRAVFLIKAR
jgi:peptidoglycan-associated lipoprotein